VIGVRAGRGGVGAAGCGGQGGRAAGVRSLHEALDTTTPGGRLVFHVSAALAEFIRELIIKGTHEGLAAAKALGRPTRAAALTNTAKTTLRPTDMPSDLRRSHIRPFFGEYYRGPDQLGGHGRVADIVPATTTQTSKADRNERALAIERRQAERFGAPTLADYRKVYQSSGWPWPGDAAIRRDYPVADAC
jgi:hypothetical protein